LGLSLILIHPLGIYGVALGSLLPGLVLQPYILKVCCRELGVTMSEYFKLVLAPCIIPVLVMTAAMAVLTSTIEVDGYTKLLSIAVVTTLLFSVVAFMLTLSRSERGELVGVFRRS